MKHAIISTKPAFSAATSRILVWVCLGVAFFFVIAPLLFMLTAAFMPAGDIIKMPYRWFPRSFYFMNFVKAVAGNDGSYIFFRNLFNSLVVAVTVSVTTVLISSLTGYSLSKFHYRGRDAIFMGIMATMMIPFEAIMIPLYIVVTKMGIQNSYPGLILPFLVNAFGIFMMRQYLITFPDELIDAARVGRNERVCHLPPHYPAELRPGDRDPGDTFLPNPVGQPVMAAPGRSNREDEDHPPIHRQVQRGDAHR